MVLLSSMGCCTATGELSNSTCAESAIVVTATYNISIINRNWFTLSTGIKVDVVVKVVSSSPKPSVSPSASSSSDTALPSFLCNIICLFPLAWLQCNLRDVAHFFCKI